MNRFPAAVLAPLVLASGCTGHFERSYDRWSGYVRGYGPYSKGAQCIDERANHYLNYDSDRAENAPDPDSPRAELFTYVLADCRAFMSDSEWRTLQDKQVRRLIGDAWQAFNNVGNEIRARLEEGII
jgi:hypothetical protein